MSAGYALRCEGQFDDERGVAGDAVHVDGAVVRPDHRRDDGQAQTGAAAVAGP